MIAKRVTAAPNQLDLGLPARMLGVVNDILTSKGPMLRAGAPVDATLIAAPSSTEKKEGKRGAEMHQWSNGHRPNRHARPKLLRRRSVFLRGF